MDQEHANETEAHCSFQLDNGKGVDDYVKLDQLPKLADTVLLTKKKGDDPRSFGRSFWGHEVPELKVAFPKIQISYSGAVALRLTLDNRNFLLRISVPDVYPLQKPTFDVDYLDFSPLPDLYLLKMKSMLRDYVEKLHVNQLGCVKSICTYAHSIFTNPDNFKSYTAEYSIPREIQPTEWTDEPAIVLASRGEKAPNTLYSLHCTSENRLYIFGGINEDGYAINKSFYWDMVKKRRVSLNPMPYITSHGTASVVGSEIYLLSLEGFCRYFTETDTYENLGHWRNIKCLSSSSGVYVPHMDSILYFGGRFSNSSRSVITHSKELMIVQLKSERAIFKRMDVMPREAHTTVLYQDKMYIAGGVSSTLIPASSVLELDTHTWSWRELMAPSWFSPLSNMRSFVTSMGIYLYGGDGFSSKQVLTLFKPETNAWERCLVCSDAILPVKGQACGLLMGYTLVVIGGGQESERNYQQTRSTVFKRLIYSLSTTRYTFVLGFNSIQASQSQLVDQISGVQNRTREFPYDLRIDLVSHKRPAQNMHQDIAQSSTNPADSQLEDGSCQLPQQQHHEQKQHQQHTIFWAHSWLVRARMPAVHLTHWHTLESEEPETPVHVDVSHTKIASYAAADNHQQTLATNECRYSRIAHELRVICPLNTDADVAIAAFEALIVYMYSDSVDELQSQYNIVRWVAILYEVLDWQHDSFSESILRMIKKMFYALTFNDERSPREVVQFIMQIVPVGNSDRSAHCCRVLFDSLACELSLPDRIMFAFEHGESFVVNEYNTLDISSLLLQQKPETSAGESTVDSSFSQTRSPSILQSNLSVDLERLFRHFNPQPHHPDDEGLCISYLFDIESQEIVSSPDLRSNSSSSLPSSAGLCTKSRITEEKEDDAASCQSEEKSEAFCETPPNVKVFARCATTREEYFISVHKSILLLRCQFFRDMFSAGMLENTTNEVHIREYSLQVVSIALEYLYSDKLEITDPQLAIDLIPLCRLWSLHRLREMSEAIIAQYIDFTDPVTVISLVHLADLYQAQHIFALCSFELLCRLGYDKCSKAEGFDALSSSLRSQFHLLAIKYAPSVREVQSALQNKLTTTVPNAHAPVLSKRQQQQSVKLEQLRREEKTTSKPKTPLTPSQLTMVPKPKRNRQYRSYMLKKYSK